MCCIPGGIDVSDESVQAFSKIVLRVVRILVIGQQNKIYFSRLRCCKLATYEKGHLIQDHNFVNSKLKRDVFLDTLIV